MKAALQRCIMPSPSGEGEGQRSGRAVVNDTPGACQSREVTEPQRDPLAVDEVFPCAQS